jgi:hypothetical protein
MTMSCTAQRVSTAIISTSPSFIQRIANDRRSVRALLQCTTSKTAYGGETIDFGSHMIHKIEKSHPYFLRQQPTPKKKLSIFTQTFVLIHADTPLNEVTVTVEDQQELPLTTHPSPSPPASLSYPKDTVL